MMTLKAKTLVLAAVAAVVLGIVGCGGNQASGSAPPAATGDATAAPTGEPAPAGTGTGTAQ